MADLTDEERAAYEDQYTRGLRKMRDFRIYTQAFLDEIEFMSAVWPERIIFHEHKIPEVKERINGTFVISF